jgi:hypothetical protein
MEGGLPKVAVRLIESSARYGLTLRLAGSVGILVLMNSHGLGRSEYPKDIDIAARAAERMRVQSFLAVHGWLIASDLLLVSELRETYLLADPNLTLDVFYDEIDGNHPIAIANRLECSWPTLSWTDLLLTKLQRRHMRPEDVWDVTLLLSSLDRLDPPAFQKALGCNWSLYTTIMDNFAYVKEIVPSRAAEIDRLQLLAFRTSKSLGWKLRARIGRRVKWWREVSDAQT